MRPERTQALARGNELLKAQIAIALADPHGHQRRDPRVITTQIIRRQPGHDPVAATTLYRSPACSP